MVLCSSAVFRLQAVSADVRGRCPHHPQTFATRKPPLIESDVLLHAA